MLNVWRLLAPSGRRLRWLSTAATPPLHTTGEQHILDKLDDRFRPTELMVQDVSGHCQHSNHPTVELTIFIPDTGGCGTFYAITIASRDFNGLTKVKQHKLVTETLKQEIEQIHGLQVISS
jgi:stress-induced morphogen